MGLKDMIQKIPTLCSKPETDAVINQHKDWFYSFTFTNGASTVVNDNQVDQIHTSRAAMIFPYLDDVYNGKWNSLTCCDLACHQGWFATQIALRGAQHVVGIDARHHHIQMAEEIKSLSNLSNLSFSKQDLFSITMGKFGLFDLTLFLGILYHLDNPMDALRIVRSITKSLCIIETQVARCSTKLECTWGTGSEHRSGAGIAVIPSDKIHVHSGHTITFVPTVEALYTMLFAAGFSRIYQCIPSTTMNEQYLSNDRIILFAHV